MTSLQKLIPWYLAINNLFVSINQDKPSNLWIVSAKSETVLQLETRPMGNGLLFNPYPNKTVLNLAQQMMELECHIIKGQIQHWSMTIPPCHDPVDVTQVIILP